jgi:hypothetical protein
MKNLFVEVTKVAFWDFHKADYEFLGSFIYRKHHLSNFIQVTFLDPQDAENEYGLSTS